MGILLTKRAANAAGFLSTEAVVPRTQKNLAKARFHDTSSAPKRGLALSQGSRGGYTALILIISGRSNSACSAINA